MNRYKKRWIFPLGMWLAGALLLLSPVRAEAHLDLNPLNLGHNRPSHLVSTVGLDACIAAVNTIRGINSSFADSIGLTAQGCRDAANSISQTAREAEQVVQDTARDVIDCAADPAGCAEKIATDLGVDDPNLGKMAILTGNVSFETGGLLFSDFGITNVDITDIDDSKVSAACKAFIALPWSRGGALTLTTGGSYRLVVPACGPITYTLKPSNPLFTWNPPTRTITVGAGGGASSSGGGSGESGFQGGTIGVENQQQMEMTEGASGQMMQQQQQQRNDSTGNSGKQSTQSQQGKKKKRILRMKR